MRRYISPFRHAHIGLSPFYSDRRTAQAGSRPLILLGMKDSITRELHRREGNVKKGFRMSVSECHVNNQREEEAPWGTTKGWLFCGMACGTGRRWGLPYLQGDPPQQGLARLHDLIDLPRLQAVPVDAGHHHHVPVQPA